MLVGQKRFYLNNTDSTDYVVVISAKMREDILKRNVFNQQETYSILRRAQEIVIEMKRPNLQYLLLNTFETHKTKDFFIC